MGAKLDLDGLAERRAVVLDARISREDRGRDAALRLRSMRHQNPETKWESNDLNDIAYLACAVVHCDVIVTEKQWVHELRRSGLLEQHSTEAIGDVRELPEVLVAAVR